MAKLLPDYNRFKVTSLFLILHSAHEGDKGYDMSSISSAMMTYKAELKANKIPSIWD